MPRRYASPPDQQQAWSAESAREKTRVSDRSRARDMIAAQLKSLHEDLAYNYRQSNEQFQRQYGHMRQSDPQAFKQAQAEYTQRWYDLVDRSMQQYADQLSRSFEEQGYPYEAQMGMALDRSGRAMPGASLAPKPPAIANGLLAPPQSPVKGPPQY